MIVPAGTDERSDVGTCPRRRYRSTLFVACAALVLGLVMSLGIGVGSASAYSDGYVNASVLNLRDGPGLWATVVNRMYDGEYVGVLDGPTDDGWYLVDYYGTTGWAYGSYLWMNGGLGWSSGGYGSAAWVDAAALNLRASASGGAAVLDVLSSNTEVYVTGGYVGGLRSSAGQRYLRLGLGRLPVLLQADVGVLYARPMD